MTRKPRKPSPPVLRPNTDRLEREIVSFDRDEVEYASRCEQCGAKVKSAIRSARLVLVCSAGCGWHSEPLVDHPGGLDQEAMLRRIAALCSEPVQRLEPVLRLEPIQSAVLGDASLVSLDEAFGWTASGGNR